MRPSMPRPSNDYSGRTGLRAKIGSGPTLFTLMAASAALLPLTVACSGLQNPDSATTPAPETSHTGSPDASGGHSSSKVQNSTEGPDNPTATTPGVKPTTAPSQPNQDGSPTSNSPAPTKVTRKQRGDGKLTRYQYTGPTPDVPDGAKVRRISFATEGGIGVDPQELAETALRILNDKRSWAGSGFVFVPVNKNPHTTIIVASPVHSANLCRPLQTGGVLSCRKGNRVILTNYRWVNGHRDFKGDLDKYRTYLINHEVGHSLGHGHVDCPGKGKLAPVMMQQSKGTLGCIANGWVHPHNKN